MFPLALLVGAAATSADDALTKLGGDIVGNGMLATVIYLLGRSFLEQLSKFRSEAAEREVANLEAQTKREEAMNKRLETIAQNFQADSKSIWQEHLTMSRELYAVIRELGKTVENNNLVIATLSSKVEHLRTRTETTLVDLTHVFKNRACLLAREEEEEARRKNHPGDDKRP